MSSAAPIIEDQQELALELRERPDIVALVEARSFLPDKPVKLFTRSGKWLIKRLKNDEDFAMALCSAIRQGLSGRLIAKRFGIARDSIAAVKQAMTDRGELRPVRLRIDRLLDQFVEEGFEAVLDGVREGTIHPGQLPIAVLAGYDKKAQRDAGMVVGTQRTVADVTVEQVLADLAAARALAESPSVAIPPPAVEIEASVVPDTGLDTGARPRQALSEPAAPLDQAPPPARPGPAAATASPPPDGGGGGGRGPDPQKDRWEGPENSAP